MFDRVCVGDNWAITLELEPLSLLPLTLCMNTLFYIDCLCHEELKNILQNDLWELYAVTWLVGRMDGMGLITPP